jgi:hypothetical protein
VRSTEQRRIRTFVATVNSLRGSVGPKFRACWLICSVSEGVVSLHVLTRAPWRTRHITIEGPFVPSVFQEEMVR